MNFIFRRRIRLARVHRDWPIYKGRYFHFVEVWVEHFWMLVRPDTVRKRVENLSNLSWQSEKNFHFFLFSRICVPRLAWDICLVNTHVARTSFLTRHFKRHSQPCNYTSRILARRTKKCMALDSARRRTHLIVKSHNFGNLLVACAEKDFVKSEDFLSAVAE